MKFKLKNYNHKVDLLFTLALFCVFTATALIVVLIGANVYKSIASNMEHSFSDRTAIAYITEKVRQNDTENAISIGNIENKQALCIKQHSDTQAFVTYIYSYNGWLYEIFAKDTFEVTLGMGQKLVKTQNLQMQISQEGILSITTQTVENTESTVKLFLKSE